MRQLLKKCLVNKSLLPEWNHLLLAYEANALPTKLERPLKTKVDFIFNYCVPSDLLTDNIKYFKLIDVQP